jgi:hypothetical protein
MMRLKVVPDVVQSVIDAAQWCLTLVMLGLESNRPIFALGYLNVTMLHVIGS